MHIHFHSESNIGDQLNTWLWSGLLGCEIQDLAPRDGLFVGIGTILRPSLASDPRRKFVFGAGCGYEQPPKLDHSWHVDFVRGPLSARALGLGPANVVTDPAVMVRKFFERKPPPTRRVGFMPHFATATLCRFQGVCESLGIQFIDPRKSYTEVIPAIAGCSLLIAEAMHGAIIADALRVPWVGVRTRASILKYKWKDWAQSLGMSPSLHFVPPLYSTGAKRMLSNCFMPLAATRLRTLGACRGNTSEQVALDQACSEIDRRLNLLRGRRLPR